MRILQLKCPSCGSELEVEDSLDTFYCKYCGTKIILADQSDQLIKAKVDIAKLSHEERMYKMQLEEEKRKDITEWKALAFGLLFIFVLLLFLAFYESRIG